MTFCLHCLSCSLAHSTSVPLLSPAFLKPAECMCPQDLCTNRPSVCRTPPPRSHRLAFIPPSDICLSATSLSSFFPTTAHHHHDALLQSQTSQPQLIIFPTTAHHCDDALLWSQSFLSWSPHSSPLQMLYLLISWCVV